MPPAGGAGLVNNAERQRRREAEGFSRVEHVDRVVIFCMFSTFYTVQINPGDISYPLSPIPYPLSAREARCAGRYRAETRKLPGARFARLRRARRHIEASFMWRQSRRTASGRPRQIGKPPPADWEIFGSYPH